MKITRKQLRKMIQENIGSILKEEIEDDAQLKQADTHAKAAIAAAEDGNWTTGEEPLGVAKDHWDKLTLLVSGTGGYHSSGIQDKDLDEFTREVNDEMASARAALARHQNLNEETGEMMSRVGETPIAKILKLIAADYDKEFFTGDYVNMIMIEDVWKKIPELTQDQLTALKEHEKLKKRLKLITQPDFLVNLKRDLRITEEEIK